MKRAKRPTPLKRGDLIAIAAPSGPFDRNRFLKGVALLKKSGFRITYEKGIFSRKDYLAGDDRRRARELNRHLSDPRSKALLIARGGFGTQRLLPLLQPNCHPKVVVGFSDLTVLLNYLWQRYRLPSFYGPMVAPHLIHRDNVSRLVQALTDPRFMTKQPLLAKRALKPGKAEGRLVGGCLSLVTSTLGTPWEINTSGALFFLEDTHEEPYAVDRMMTQLDQAGKFKNVRGILFGTFRQGRTLFPAKIEAVVREKLKDFPGPVLWGVRFGHCPKPLLVPVGGRGRIEGKKLLITEGIF